MLNGQDLPAMMYHIDELNEQAFDIRVSDSTRSFAISKEALDLSEKIGYTHGKAEALRMVGFGYIRRSDNTKALSCFEQALQLFESLNDRGGQGYVYTGLGIVQRNLGNYKVSLESFFKSLELIRGTKYAEVEPLIYYHLGITYKYLGNLEQALEYALQSLSSGKQFNDWISEGYTLHTLGTLYDELGEYPNALEYYHQGLNIRKQHGDKWGEAGSLNNIGNLYLKQGDYTRSREHCEQSLSIARTVGDKKGEANSLFHLAIIESAKGNRAFAVERAKESLLIREKIGDKKGQIEIYLYMADAAIQELPESEQKHLQLQLLNKALSLAEDIGAQDSLSKIHYSFYKLFKKYGDYQKALSHLEEYNMLEKEIHSKAFNNKIINLEITHKVEQSKQEAEIYRLRNVELVDLFEESRKQKEEIQAALTELRSTQAQLIQKEKMASLGELTAGIAHEIQNPLNFVNNFSEVNKELIEELEGERSKANGERDEEQEAGILNDIKQNTEKILHHGKRADAIVKGMLQHSRASTGKKEPADINALTDEYLRLSYHGMRAKDKNFNAEIETDFDEGIGKIKIVPQDIGRVLLNLFNNAFYTVNEKTKQQAASYKPQVTVQTKRLNDKIEIRVADNGDGIPQNIVDKIFQPFFTTKPTGQGTGLGLSLSYDIIKAHAGEIKVESKEGEGSEFIIQLPIKT